MAFSMRAKRRRTLWEDARNLPNLLTFLLYGALGGSLFFVPLNLIQVQNYSTTAAGAAMLPCLAVISQCDGRVASEAVTKASTPASTAGSP